VGFSAVLPSTFFLLFHYAAGSRLVLLRRFDSVRTFVISCLRCLSKTVLVIKAARCNCWSTFCFRWSPPGKFSTDLIVPAASIVPSCRECSQVPCSYDSLNITQLQLRSARSCASAWRGIRPLVSEFIPRIPLLLLARTTGDEPFCP